MAMIRAIALKDFRTNALSTTDNSTAFQLGAVTTGQNVYGAMHLTSAYGSTDRVISMAIQSATASGFPTPVTRITFSTASPQPAYSTVANGSWGQPAGNFSTDHTWWRASWIMSTTASTNGSWKGLVEMGIR